MTEAPLSVTVPEWTLTDRLKKARERAGFTQVEMARELGIGRSTVAAYESGKNATPRKIVLAWAMITSVPPGWLWDGVTAGQRDVNKLGYRPPMRHLRLLTTRSAA
jgi:transcriptional regulator with XRE-family HTH domain